jgi:hypothetical protein
MHSGPVIGAQLHYLEHFLMSMRQYQYVHIARTSHNLHHLVSDKSLTTHPVR